jgi:CMP/dCMP kinase
LIVLSIKDAPKNNFLVRYMMTIITISRKYGSGDEEITNKICQALGYRQFSKLEIARAAEDTGLVEFENIDFSEDNYKAKSFFERLFNRSSNVAQFRVWKEEANGERHVENINIDEENALALVQKAINRAYETGNMVIVGRGGQIILKGKPNCLHVRIKANLIDRIHRVMNQIEEEQKGFGAGDETQLQHRAQEIISQRDNDSAAYIKHFYGYDWDDPSLYDTIINTSSVDLDTAAQIILKEVQTLQPVH